MIESIKLSNFKAFSTKQNVGLKPITLVYGPNSAGKSSLLQSLLLLRQSMNEINIDDTALITKGKLLDLGNYHEMVHKHKIEENITIANTFQFKEGPRIARWKEIVNSATYEAVFSCDKSRLINLDKINLYYNNSNIPFMSLKKSDKRLRVFRRIKITRNIRGVHENNYIIEKINIEDPIVNMLFNHINRNNRNEHNAINDLEEFRKELQSYSEKIIVNVDGFLITGIGIDFENDFENDGSTSRVFRSLGIDDLLMMTSINYTNALASITYLGPLREYPERHYIFSGSSPSNVGKSGRNMSDLLFINQSLIKEVNKWLDIFGIDYSMQINRLKDSEVSDVYSMRLIDKISNVSVSPLDVGFGISQILPIIVQSLISKNGTICIEQPEIHIHPRLQTVFGTFLSECIKENNQFIIETHSEHILLRLQRLIKEGILTNDDISVIYVQRTENGSKCLELRIDEDGDFLDEWPDGFFDEAYKEVFF